MAVPKRKTAKSATRSRRSANMKMTAKTLVKCSNCGEFALPHHVCAECGHDKGREVIAKQISIVEKKKGHVGQACPFYIYIYSIYITLKI